MNRLMRALALAALTGLTTASAGAALLSAGQTVRFGAATVTVLSVTDSRCPPRVQCVRAGEVTARVLVSRPGSSQLLTLRYPEAGDARWAGFRLAGATRRTARSTPTRIILSDQPARR